MDHLAEQFVSRRQGLGLVGPGRRVPKNLRQLALRFARPKIEAGATVNAIAERLGVLPATLERWLDSERAEPTLREVIVCDEKPSALEVDERSLILTTPDGFRIEGVTAAELPNLLRSLR